MELDPGTLRLVIHVAISLLTAAFAGGGAYFGVTVKMKFLERDVDRNRDDLKELRSESRDEIAKLHSRINRITERVRPNGSGG